MPYSAEHKERTRRRITDTARFLFNRHGFAGVTIDSVMEAAGLTRGGFYNHFSSKEQLYREAVSGFLDGRGVQWREAAGVEGVPPDSETTRRMLNSYLSVDHLNDKDGQCPMIALPSDVARSSPEVQQAYQGLLEAMVGLFEADLRQRSEESRQRALSLVALCVGGMILARTLPDCVLAEEVRAAALQTANEISAGHSL